MPGPLSVTQVSDDRVVPLGERGESIAAEFLRSQNYRIVLTNFRVPVGRNSKGVARTGEIDIIALDGDTLCFIEVKTRTSEDFTRAITNVDLRKRIQITRTARIYKSIFDVSDIETRYDVVTVVMPRDSEPSAELFKGYWTEAGLRRRKPYPADNIPF